MASSTAAGILFVCPSTGRMLLGFRSEYVNAPFCWSVVGGTLESGEEPEHGALREAREEVGYSGQVTLVPSLVYVRPENFRYYNFIGLVEKEFRPELNDEHVDARWFYPDRAPSPLHHGTALLLHRARSQVMRAAAGGY